MQSLSTLIWDLLTNPTVAYLLLIVGLWAVVFSITVPGAGLPEATAVICLALAIIGLTHWPINLAGLGLLALAFVLFIIEFQVMSHGALLFAGTISLIIGSLLLFRPAPGAATAVSWVTILLVSLSTSSGFGFLIYKGLAAQSLPRVHDSGRLIGAVGVARTDIVKGEGAVYVGGELWSATASEAITAGTTVKVIGREGLRLKVIAQSEDQTT